MKSVNMSLASDQDKGITIRTSQFPQLVFSDNVFRYYLEVKGLPLAIPMTLSRNGETLYTGALNPYVRALIEVSVGFPKIGSPVEIQANLGKQVISIN